ncbi:hypothetical protein SDC9_115579 [bioreactor metagenome]|uniref:Uncharacterized protein n=1 Tax=bioreactor metagenome TaxID=1076179 RepID=A0A645BTJ0_9ZZZZ
MVARGAVRDGGDAVRQDAVQVLLLQHPAELLRAPVGHQELQPGLVAQPPVAVVAEQRDDAGPDLGRLLGADEDPDPLGEPGGGGEPAADPQVVARAVLRVADPDEGDVVDLVHHVEAGVPGDRRLELPRQVRESRGPDVGLAELLDQRRGVEDLVGGDARDRAAEEAAGGVTAGGDGVQPDRLQPTPDLRDVLDPDPVVLDVLPVGDVEGVAGEVLRDAGQHADLVGAEDLAVDPDPVHEVPVRQLRIGQLAGPGGVEVLVALGVEPPPAQPAEEVIGRDGVEALMGVRPEDPGADVQAVVLVLDHLVGIEGRTAVDGPLTVGPVLLGSSDTLRDGRVSRCGRGGRAVVGHRVSSASGQVVTGVPYGAAAPRGCSEARLRYHLRLTIP